VIRRYMSVVRIVWTWYVHGSFVAFIQIIGEPPPPPPEGERWGVRGAWGPSRFCLRSHSMSFPGIASTLATGLVIAASRSGSVLISALLATFLTFIIIIGLLHFTLIPV